MRFVWHAAKAAPNLRKHGVSFEEAMTVFGDPLASIVSDPVSQDRFVTIGESSGGRVLYTVRVESRQDVVRILSARRATPREAKGYEEGEGT